MRLAILTPDALVVDRRVRGVRAEDASGAFGILPRHADLLTVLTVSVIAYRSEANDEHFVAVRGGILTVSGGDLVDVVTRQAVASDDVDLLEHEVLARLRESAAIDERAWGGIKRLEGALLYRVAESIRLEHPRGIAPPRGTPWRR